MTSVWFLLIFHLTVFSRANFKLLSNIFHIKSDYISEMGVKKHFFIITVVLYNCRPVFLFSFMNNKHRLLPFGGMRSYYLSHTHKTYELVEIACCL